MYIVFVSRRTYVCVVMELHRKLILSVFPSYEETTVIEGMFMLKIFLGAYGSNIVQFRYNEGYTEQTYIQKSVS